jgi:Kelch motif
MRKLFSYLLVIALLLVFGRSSAFASTSDSTWNVIARMPFPNHDITGVVLNGKLYISGGCTVLPNQKMTKMFDEVWELTPNPWHWRVAAKLMCTRIYNTTVAFEGKIWVIGGDLLELDSTRKPTNTVEIYDPKIGRVNKGPETTIARSVPVAMVAAGRLYVIGTPSLRQANPPCSVESIGPGETEWRREPDGPKGMGLIVGCSFNDKIYINLPKPGLVIFDPKNNSWETVSSPIPTRSCQMATYNGEIWMIGGRNGQGGTQTMIFNPTHHTWRQGTPIPIDTSWGATGVIGGELIMTGGARSGEFYDATYILKINKKDK